MNNDSKAMRAARAALVAKRPWMSDAEIAFMAEHLEKSDRVLEYGAGGSTVWFARNCQQVVSIEHIEAWAVAVRDALSACVLPDDNPYRAVISYQKGHEYLEQFPQDRFGAPTWGSIMSTPRWIDWHRYALAGPLACATLRVRPDVCLLDGRARVECALAVWPLARAGMRVFLHDAQRPRYAAIAGGYREAGRCETLALLEAI